MCSSVAVEHIEMEWAKGVFRFEKGVKKRK
jgi:hypothetical protein